MSVFRLTVWLVLLVAIFVPLERLFALHPEKIWRKQVGVDIGWYFINSLLPAALIALPLAALASLLQTINPFGLYSLVATLPIWLNLLLIFVVNDIGAYWGHRASHRYAFLWRFHSVHHSAEHMDWLVNTRAHPMDMVVTRLSGLVPVYLLGLAQTSTGSSVNLGVAAVMVTGTIWSFFIHSNIKVRLGPLEWLISSPAFHHWHHTNDDHKDKNFAAVFPWVDRIFGTSWLPKHWPPVYGIDAETPTTLKEQLLDPLKEKAKKKQPEPLPQSSEG